MDIQKIVCDLIDAGVTQVEIAKAIDVEQPTVSRYASGAIKECSYSVGKSLIELHMLRVQRSRAATRARS